MKVGVVIPARNEEKNLDRVLNCLYNQTLKPMEVVVVDDGSTDNTPVIAENYGATVIRLRRESSVSRAGTPYMAYVINKGFEYLRDRELDFVMVLGADHILPKHYLSTITERMVRDKVVVASGVIYGEVPGKDIDVRGSGRVIEVEWFRRVGFAYPLNWGFEAWLIYKALSMGMKVRVYRDLITWTLRRTAISATRYYYWGAGMKALGYHPLYSLGRFIRVLQKSKTKGIYLLRGYMSRVRQYSDVKDFVYNFQLREVLRITSLLHSSL